jgi:DNA-directed RNA polymerase subunit RPC12/RpoP
MECTVPVEVHLATEHADVGSLERVISTALADVGVRLWHELVGRLEATLPAPASCPACSGRLKANGRAPRRLVTLAGEVELRRRRYRCLDCGTEVVPLDAALGLEPRIQHTLGVQERGLWLVTEMSYQRAVDVAAELRRWPIGRGELHRWVADEGARIEAATDAQTEALLGDRPVRERDGPRRGTVWVSADGTMVHDRASGTEFEVKVGLVFDGARRTGRTRRALTGRTYVGGTGSWTTFAERFTATCARLGVFDAERICFVSDGAAAIRWIRARSFPTAIELLDWYHLVEALRRAIGDERTDRLEAALAIVAPGDAEGLLELLAGWAFEEAGLDLARSAKLTAVWGYVAANRRAIENYAIVPLASSGPMEKGVDLVVARRFKARGMSWFRRGASPLLHLRLLRLNGTWARYWSERFAALLRPWPSSA